MKRRFRVIIISYIAAAFAVMGGFILSAQQQAKTYKMQVNNSYRHAFSELVTGVEEMTSALEKSLYATTPGMISSVCTDVFGKAMSAQAAMGQLPFSEYELEQTAGFIAKVGDYAYMLSKNAYSANGYTDEQYSNLKALSESASSLAKNLTSLMDDIDDGTISITALAAADKATPVLGDSFKTIESEFPEVPSLIYDGPFSEHVAQMEPAYLKDMADASQEEAQRSAAEFLSIDEENLTFEGMRSGSLEAYMFSCRINNGQKYVEVTKRGAVVLNMISEREPAQSNIGINDARKIAARFLQSIDCGSMRESYYMQQDNILTINYAYVQNDIVCYTDLIKVSVALDNGEIVGYEAMGYIMSHTQRDIPAAQIDEATAQQRVAGELKILSHQMAVIPTDGKYEKFCHEFKCENEDGKHYIIYVNAVTGGEEKILILVEDENGTLTI